MTKKMAWLAALPFVFCAAAVSAQDPAPGDGDGDIAAPPPTQVETPAPPAPTPPPPPASSRETACNDDADDDGDGLTDCADADCFDDAHCAAGGSDEQTADRCSDWIDNDGDDAVDCEDQGCQALDICQGSLPGGGHGEVTSHGGGGDDLPELSEGMTVDDLIGNFGDADGERNDHLCSDGLDNDGDGRTDCSDFGCRFDPSVTVCSATPSLRFSVVAGIGATHNFDATDTELADDVRFTRLQLRVMGPIPGIEDSFYLLSMRVERSPRLTFAMFEVPIGDTGHSLNINSGSGGLSSALILSTSKHPLLDPAFYMTNAFEQGNGAAVEVSGALTSNGALRYRLFAAGGAGQSNGNVGGRFFRTEQQNFTWGVGGQLHVNLVGFFDRFDTAYLYTPAPTALGLLVGAKYDQRERERYPAFNGFLVFRHGHLLLRAESYTKRELEFGAWQTAWNAQASVLLWPRHLMIAADVGQFLAFDFDEDPDFDSLLRRPLDETQIRAAIHWFYYRQTGLISLLYTHRIIDENPDRPEDTTTEREIRLEAQFRF